MIVKLAVFEEGNNIPKQTSINIGPSLMVAASEKLREDKKNAFEFAIGQIGKSDITGERSSPAILAAVNDFLGSQITPDSEVAQWIQTWEGRIFTIQHGLKKCRKDQEFSRSDCEDLIDNMSHPSYEQIVYAVDCLIAGETQAHIRQIQVSTEISRQQVRLERQKSELEAEKYQLEIQAMETASFAKRAETQGENSLQEEASNFTTSADATSSQ